MRLHCIFTIMLLLVGASARVWGQAGSSTRQVHSAAYVDSINGHILQVSNRNRDSAISLIDYRLKEYADAGFTYGYARALSLKSWLLVFQARYEKSLELAHEALQLQNSMEDSTGMALTLNRIGAANLQFKRLKDAEKYFSRALALFQKLGDTANMEMCLNNLGALAYGQKDYGEALQYFERSGRILQGLHRYSDLAYNRYNLADIHLVAGDLAKSRSYFLSSMRTFEDSARQPIPAVVLEGYGRLNLRMKEYQQAEKYLAQALKTAGNDQHTEVELSSSEYLADLLYEMGKYREAYNIRSFHDSLAARVDSANNARNVAEIEEKYKNIENEAQISKLAARNLETENKLQRSRLITFYIGGGACLGVLLMIWLIWRRRLKQQARESRLAAKVLEHKLTALRAQMNPHFIFNCLNTAQNFVLSANKKAAYTYLANFAKLLRMVLENSNHQYLPVEEEVEQLRLYIELEMERFDQRFTYDIEVDEALVSGGYEMPGMILQPLVENAILHGIMNLPTDQQGHLMLRFSLVDHRVDCRIEDNGVGREKALEVKKKKEVHYESAALPNIRERLTSLDMYDGKDPSHFEVEDLHTNGSPSGTRVSLSLPLK